jgi:hypothetical protein
LGDSSNEATTIRQRSLISFSHKGFVFYTYWHFVHLKFATIEGFLVSSWEHFDFSRFFKQGTMKAWIRMTKLCL